MPLMPLPDSVKRFLPIAFALILGLIAAAMNRSYLHTQRRALEAERQQLLAAYKAPIEVVVAGKDLPENEVIQPAHLRRGVVPERFVQPYAARRPEEVVGRVTVAPIAEGEQVLLNKLRRPEEGPSGISLSSVMPKGTRAVTIAVDILSGVGGFVRPGDVVDVLWTLQVPQPGQPQPQPLTLTLFQDVPVLAVAQESLAGESGRAKSSESQPYTVTLALNPQETSFMLFARDQGRVQLSLRPRSETGTKVAVAPASVGTLNAMLEQQFGISSAPPEAPATRQIEVYKGLERGVVDVPEQQR